MKSRLARAAAEGAGGKVFDVHDPESLDELMEECVSGRSSWAHLGHIGPAINNSFRSVLECFPCSDPKCMKAKLKGGGKMFCLLRFILDPGHVMPAIRRKSVLRCFKYGKEIQRFAGLYVKTFEQKRTAHNWGTLRVDVIMQAGGCVACAPHTRCAQRWYSAAGEREYNMSGCCEACFDDLAVESEGGSPSGMVVLIREGNGIVNF